MLLIVFRGNYSEGYDFKDDLCRAMVVLGQPYPNKEKNLKMKLKAQLMGKVEYD